MPTHHHLDLFPDIGPYFLILKSNPLETMLSISSLSPSSFTLLRRRVDRLLRGCQVDMRITTL
jgi:hypothetical protein